MTAEPDSRFSARAAIRSAWLADETSYVEKLVPMAEMPPEATSQVMRFAQKLISLSREKFFSHGGLDAFLQEYDLSSQEGVTLMCLAEALLRIPDKETANRLIQDKLSNADWSTHLGASHSLFVNASTWGLMLTGQVVSFDEDSHDLKKFFKRLANRSGEPLIRLALKEAMQIMARQFVMGKTIDEAISRARSSYGQQCLFSFDMLGEAAVTYEDAEGYFERYRESISEIADRYPPSEEDFSLPVERPGISIKLSALHPRLEITQRRRVLKEIIPKVKQLCLLAMDANIGVTLDAEESAVLELQLDVFESLFAQPEFADWSGLGIAVQAYQKRAYPLIQWLAALAEEHNKMIMVRLVKGAYWDTEIKQAQLMGLESYPVFTRKVNTDISYLACTRLLSEHTSLLYPQFATHNAFTLAAVSEIMQHKGLYEFQRLHGMGDSVFAALLDGDGTSFPVRVYAPVGSHQSLLPYLVRRLLENGANTSFLNRFADRETDIAELIRPPVETLRRLEQIPHPEIPLPPALYGESRRNAKGYNLDNPDSCQAFEDAALAPIDYDASCLVDGEALGERPCTVTNPADPDERLGCYLQANDEITQAACAAALAARPQWQATGVAQRCEYLENLAVLIEQHDSQLAALIVKEGGRCIHDALAEIREAVDYCRYYAQQATELFAQSRRLTGPTGELNELSWHGCGVFLCISPWNFPLAIFLGQITAALAAGNTVIAKPARQSSLTAWYAVRLCHQAGIPPSVLQLLLGSGAGIARTLLDEPALAGIAFTGSTETASLLQRRLADRPGPILPLIAETGGQNAMIADSSALLEQLVKDVVTSAFNSAGQRCSALRVLFVQQEIADRFCEMLCGAIDTLAIGNPAQISTDIGPVIDRDAQQKLQQHIELMREQGRMIHQQRLPATLDAGCFVPPTVFEIEDIGQLKHEVFGPILHLIRFEAGQLDEVVDAINSTGYGLTLGIHSRIETAVRQILARAKAGNIYVNRNMIGALVGVQPFGGEGLSGTGPKAGGPNYLQAFAIERTLSINTTAIGGNTSLMSLKESS